MESNRITRRTAGFAALAAATGAAPVRAQTHPLRGGADFVALEDKLLTAMRARDRATLESLMAEDFEMVVAQLPLDSIGRDAWIDNLARAGSRDVAVRALVAHPLADDLYQVTLWLVPEPARPGRGTVFVVDTWRREGDRWLLAGRHAAPLGGSRLWIPGDSGRAPLRKMI